MSPLDFYFSAAVSLDELTFHVGHVLSPGALPEFPWAGLPPENSLAFEGVPNLTRFAFFRIRDAALEIASLFGCYRLILGRVDGSREMGLLCMKEGARVASWKIKADSEWRDLSGRTPDGGALKARLLNDGEWEPVHSTLSFRGIDSKPDFWTVVLLASKAEIIENKQGSARIHAGGRVCALPPGRASDQVLAGSVQWGLPNEDGVFVLQPR